MQYTVEIERWKREVCVITVESDTADDAEDQGLTLYLGRCLEGEFNDFDKDKDVKDESIRILDDDGEQVKETVFDSHRNVFA